MRFVFFLSQTIKHKTTFFALSFFQIPHHIADDLAKNFRVVHATDKIHRLCALIRKLLAHCVFFNAFRHFDKQSVIKNSAEIHAVFIQQKFAHHGAMSQIQFCRLFEDKIQIFPVGSHTVTCQSIWYLGLPTLFLPYSIASLGQWQIHAMQ